MAARDCIDDLGNDSDKPLELASASNISEVEISNFNSRALAQHEAMIADALADGSLASDLLNDENMIASGLHVASSRSSLQSPVRYLNASPLRQMTPGRNSMVNVTPLTPPITPKVDVSKAKQPIATLVFFDLETTGLPHEMGKNNVQITELSMIAMKRMEYEKSVHTDLKDLRIVQKLSMCFQPRAAIAPMAAKITGKLFLF